MQIQDKNMLLLVWPSTQTHTEKSICVDSPKGAFEGECCLLDSLASLEFGVYAFFPLSPYKKLVEVLLWICYGGDREWKRK